MPAGYVEDGADKYSVKVGDKFTSKDEIAVSYTHLISIKKSLRSWRQRLRPLLKS